MIHDPTKIARIGLAIEFADGRRTMIFSDHPGIEVELATVREPCEWWSGELYRPPRPTDTHRTLTISGINTFTLAENSPAQTDVAIEGIQQAISKETP